MPKKRRDAPRQPKWLKALLKDYTAAQIQKGVSMRAPRVTRKRDPKAPTKRKRLIEEREYLVKGSGLKLADLRRYKRAGTAPKGAELTRLRNLFQRINYHKLRNAGANPEQAQLYKRDLNVNPLVKSYRKYVRTLAKDKGVKQIYIRWGARQSPMSKGQWDEYVKTKPYRDPEWIAQHKRDLEQEKLYRQSPYRRAKAR